ncbi:unnamed protein product [Prorocentrum cordatum]|uniref:RING-type domain-containing protein n=1 Tax=Prorocentrum cordatum TaxID=2364126 RepID=A0ABN9VWY9_9DINO|nr:unnamed protein product [Polarella glacialis]
MEDVVWQSPEQRAAPLLALGSRQAALVAPRPSGEGAGDDGASAARAAPGADEDGLPAPGGAARGRRGARRWSCLRRLRCSAACCRSWAVLLSGSLDRSALRLVGLRLDPAPAEARREAARGIWLPVLCMALLGTTALVIQLWCLVEGWYFLLARGVAPPCRPLSAWLWLYCFTLWQATATALSSSLAAFVLFVVGSSFWIGFVMIQRDMSNECRHAEPTFWSFVDQVALLGMATCILLLVNCSVMICLMRRAATIRGTTLQAVIERVFASPRPRGWGSSGATSQAVIERVFAAPRPRVHVGTECGICLEVAEDAAEWCGLFCGHAYHERCLREWLGRARRCPLCRLDLHAAYLPSESAPSDDQARANI